MKRFLALVLVLALVLAPAAVFAEDTDPVPPAMSGAGIPKQLTVEYGVAPMLDFYFAFTATQEFDGPGPELDDVVITLGGNVFSGTTNNIDYSKFDGFALGRYVYNVTETVGDVLGVDYNLEGRTGKLYVDVELVEGVRKVTPYLIIGTPEKGPKYDNFVNAYNAGDLKVTKVVTGNLGKVGDTFEIKIVLTNPTDKVADWSAVKVNDVLLTEAEISEEGETVTVVRTVDGDADNTVTITNLPAGVEYEVSEPNSGDYTVSYANEKGTIVKGEVAEATVTNDKSSNVPTGITLDNMPYIILMAVALVGLGAFALRKRAQN